MLIVNTVNDWSLWKLKAWLPTALESLAVFTLKIPVSVKHCLTVRRNTLILSVLNPAPDFIKRHELQCKASSSSWLGPAWLWHGFLCNYIAVTLRGCPFKLRLAFHCVCMHTWPYAAATCPRELVLQFETSVQLLAHSPFKCQLGFRGCHWRDWLPV